MLEIPNTPFQGATLTECRLRDLNIGDTARIVGYASVQRSYRSKLLSMGLIRGTRIQVRNVAPLGDPIHITVRDYELSLRKDEADALILVREEDPRHGAGGQRGAPGPGRRPRPGQDHRPGAGHSRRHGYQRGWRRWLRRLSRQDDET
ncbi:MAG: ferrous iron transport protein A, partial [Spirochaetales bacterium]